MKRSVNRLFSEGIAMLALFIVWTVLIQTVDVRPAGAMGTEIGFAMVNVWFHDLTGVHMALYTVTDWLGLVPVCVGVLFALLGLMQLIRRKSLLKMDQDLLLLGVYYVVVFFAYLGFEACPVNYRPILIEGRLEASYPSSTTLLVWSMMPTLVFQAERRSQRPMVRHTIRVLTVMFSLAMLVGRAVSGVHWITDILGSVLLSSGLFCLYRAMVLRMDKREVPAWNLVKNCRR